MKCRSKLLRLSSVNVQQRRCAGASSDERQPSGQPPMNRSVTPPADGGGVRLRRIIESAPAVKGVQRGRALIIDILLIQGSIAKLGRSANVPLASLGWQEEEGPQHKRGIFMGKIWT